MQKQNIEKEFSDLVTKALHANYDRDIPNDHKEILEKCIAKSSLQKNDLAMLYNFVGQIRPQTVIEVGLAGGSSAICHMLATPETILWYVAIDPFQKKWFNNRGIKKLQSCARPQQSVLLQELPSYIALPKLLEKQYRVDYAFIDSSHMFDETMIEFFYLDKMLQVGGVIVMDDRPWPMVGGVISFISKNYDHYLVDDRHPKLTFFMKTHADRRRWYDFRYFQVPWNEKAENKIRKYQMEQGTGFVQQL